MTREFNIFTVALALAVANPGLSQSASVHPQTRSHDSTVKSLAQSAETLMQRKQYAQAAVQFQRLLRLDASYHEAYFFLGACYSQTGAFADAERSLRKYLALEPASSDGHATLGLLLARTGQTSEARQELSQALTLDPRQDVARVELARQDLIVQDYAHTVSLLQSWIPTHPAEYDALAVLVEAKIGKHEYSDVIPLISQLLSRRPRQHPQFYIMLGDSLKAMGETEKALETYEQGLEIFPNWSPLEQRYLSLLRSSGRLSSVINQRLQRLRAAPDDVAELLALGSLLAISDDQSQPPPAEMSARLLEHALQLAPESASAHFDYCRLQSRLNKFDVAVEECQKALRLAADEQMKIMIYSLLGQLQADLSHPGAAEAAFKSAAQLNRVASVHDLGAAYTYIDYLSQRSRDADAQALVDEALGWSPTSATLLMQRAQLLSREGKWQQAVDSAELALSHAGENQQVEHQAHVFLARTYFRLNQTDKAQLHQQWLSAR